MNGFSYTLAQAPDPQQAESARRLLTGQAEFLKGVVAMEGLPPPDRVEICFAGRSNVGKSSLINALTGRKALARTSNTPGRTQEINFFSIGSDLYLVDLPGYGFANAPVSVVAEWQALMKAYLSGRPSLRRAFVLVDSRHGVKPVDHDIMKLLDRAAVTFQVVLTKADKIKSQDIPALVAKVSDALSQHPAAYPEMVLTSSEQNLGLATLRTIIATLR